MEWSDGCRHKWKQKKEIRIIPEELPYQNQDGIHFLEERITVFRRKCKKCGIEQRTENTKRDKITGEEETPLW